jgi:hypothetical protein
VSYGEEWGVSAHGAFLKRTDYEGADRFVFIDLRTNTIVDHRDTQVVVAGPFPNLDAAKAAFIVIYGRRTT